MVQEPGCGAGRHQSAMKILSEKLRIRMAKTEGRRRRGRQRMRWFGWHHQLNGHEFEKIPRDGEGQGSLACCSPWGHKELDTT